MTGTVTLIGAGPGDPGLMTLAGREALMRAQVVAYDSLVSAAILDMTAPDAVRIAVTKRPQVGAVPQGEIAALLAQYALEGKRVARLKGGDPFLFGRGGEEAEALAARGVPVRVIPGVTSALAAPACAGIPATYGAGAGAVHILSGSPRTGEELALDYEALARVGGTLIFLMALENLGRICGGLLAAGMAGETPAAIVERGTTPRQRRMDATLATLTGTAEREKAENPAVIVVGGVCAISYAW